MPLSRRLFLRGSAGLAGLAAAPSALNALEELVEELPSFNGSDGAIYNVKELYSNGMVFDEKDTVSLGENTEASVSYFVSKRERNDWDMPVEGIEKVSMRYALKDKQDPKKSFTVKYTGHVDENGRYSVDDVVTDGQLDYVIPDTLTRLRFEGLLLSDEGKEIFAQTVNDNLRVFDDKLKEYAASNDKLQPTPENYDPIPTKMESFSKTFRRVGEELFRNLQPDH